MGAPSDARNLSMMTDAHPVPTSASVSIIRTVDSSLQSWKEALVGSVSPVPCRRATSKKRKVPYPRLESLDNAKEDDAKDDDNPFSPEAFRKRLKTFKARTYFAKPLGISPLVCARFGWSNKSCDILQCDLCDAAICVSFDPNLSSKSVRRLTRTYRSMLATSHADLPNTCLFRDDAEQHLIEGSNDSSFECLAEVLPKEMDLFDEELSRSVVRRRVRESALGLNRATEEALEVLEWRDVSLRLSLSEDVAGFAHEMIRDPPTESMTESTPLERLSGDIFNAIDDHCETAEDDVCRGDVLEGSPSSTKAGVAISAMGAVQRAESALLAVFGWSVDPDRASSSLASPMHNRQVKIGVRCGICLARTSVQLVEKGCHEQGVDVRHGSVEKKKGSAVPHGLLDDASAKITIVPVPMASEVTKDALTNDRKGASCSPDAAVRDTTIESTEELEGSVEKRREAKEERNNYTECSAPDSPAKAKETKTGTGDELAVSGNGHVRAPPQTTQRSISNTSSSSSSLSNKECVDCVTDTRDDYTDCGAARAHTSTKRSGTASTSSPPPAKKRRTTEWVTPSARSQHVGSSKAAVAAATPSMEKRRRFIGETMDPLSSHRFFCPYVCGFPQEGTEPVIDGEAAVTVPEVATPGWKIVATKLLSPQQDATTTPMVEDMENCSGRQRQTSSLSFGTAAVQRCLNVEQAFDLVRGTLHSGISSS